MSKFTEFHLSENARMLSSTIPGEKSKVLLDFQRAHEGSIVSYPIEMPIAISHAKGAIIEDVDGNRFIDFFSGAGVLNVGHSNPYVLEYVKEQQEKLVHALDFPTENRMQLVKKILKQIPAEIRDEYKVSFCGPTGSDAVEAAIKLAKHFTGRGGVFAFQGSYHGMTSGALSATSNVKLRSRLHSMVPDITFIPYSYCYRCPFDNNKKSCTFNCADYFASLLENPHSGYDKPAAIILEPIQGEGGSIVPKDGFLERIVEISHKHGIVVIFDEVQSGFFRTGDFWAFQKDNAFPDIITMSKGLGGIGFPISAIIYNKAIESWGPGDHIGTFRGNQVSIAAGNGAFDFIEEYGVTDHVKDMGEYLLTKLHALSEVFSGIGEVRGRGLMIGIEYVTDRVSKTPDPAIVKKIRAQCVKNGLLFEIGGHYNNVIRFLPSLIINRTIIDNAMAIFEMANTEVLAESTLPEINPN
ncbi:aspartate aminotransferase family protein [Pedobacter cryoconitis]|uniref:Diaminobutyrate-2-oxoglutarate transaminase n=1 Tax=Pedobacter cryoconitis TaxID=188932 RepID=A0A327SES9_9SPHI|nr:aspartate aminotransferase family protein [Pedobacter cryoconitis]RAJ26902.1 diaminobutyrate-2-oxoglutarate transaminase [Pedobacter cryoconitis]